MCPLIKGLWERSVRFEPDTAWTLYHHSADALDFATKVLYLAILGQMPVEKEIALLEFE